jgi:membrane protein implicated in regulation of membrane protease activity
MDAFFKWWGELQPVNQWFFAAAGFFSVFFLWQLVAALLGLAGGEHDWPSHALPVHDLDTHVEAATVHETPNDPHDSTVAFKMLSIRSVLAFLTLFCWATALYIHGGQPVAAGMGYAVLWGLAAMVLVSLLLHGVLRMTEMGNQRIETCVGKTGTVYLDIPAAGTGEIRILCSGVMTHVKACCPAGAMAAGARVRVVRTAGANTVEVVAAQEAANA